MQKSEKPSKLDKILNGYQTELNLLRLRHDENFKKLDDIQKGLVQVNLRSSLEHDYPWHQSFIVAFVAVAAGIGILALVNWLLNV